MANVSSRTLIPPTTFLPSIRAILALDGISRLPECIEYLRQIFVPSVRGSRRRRTTKQASVNPTLVSIQSDPFERAYALKWLSALIRLNPDSHSVDLSQVQSDAAALLAICAGTAAAGSFQRHLEFDQARVKIALNDVPLSTNASNADYFGSVGAQTWGGACVLAEEIADHPSTFFPIHRLEKKVDVLELGAGTGLVSLVTAKVAVSHGFQTDIIATDYYPSVLDNLNANIEANFPTPSPFLSISSQFLDWSAAFTSEFAGRSFDLILGADIVYEALHASWIHSVLEAYLRKPDQGPGGLFHLVIPLRPSFAAESSTVEQVFKLGSEDSHELDSTLVVFSKEIILCDVDEVDSDDVDGRGEDGEVWYAYYVIGWKRATT